MEVSDIVSENTNIGNKKLETTLNSKKIINDEKIVIEMPESDYTGMENNLQVVNNTFPLPREHMNSYSDNNCKKNEQNINKTHEKTKIVTQTNSLGLIATAYDDSDSSDSDEPAVSAVSQPSRHLEQDVQVIKVTKSTEIEIVREDITIDGPSNGTTEYRDKLREDTDSEEDSSISDDSSSSSSSSSSSDDDSSNDTDTDSHADQHDRVNKKTCMNQRTSKATAKKGEFDDLPPIEDLKISVPEVLCDPMGEVSWMVEQMVVVKPKPSKPTLNLDTILFIDKGKRPLGHIFDVFGPVTEPHYCIRFNNAEHIKECNIKVGMTVYYCPNTPYTSLVFMTDLLKMKATDEIDDDEHPDFSDDETEKAYYATLRHRQYHQKTNRTTVLPEKRLKTSQNSFKTSWKSKHPWNTDNQAHQSQRYIRRNLHNNSSNPIKPYYNSDNTAYNSEQPQQQPYWNYQQINYYNPLNASYQWHKQPGVSRPYLSMSSIQENVNLTSPTGPSYSWPSSLTFTPTHSVPWHMPPPPPPPTPPPPPSTSTTSGISNDSND